MDVSGTDPLATESVSGVGTVWQGHSVNLSWNASTPQKVMGHNVFRGLQSGRPQPQDQFRTGPKPRL
jgi:hypothetical protein